MTKKDRVMGLIHSMIPDTEIDHPLASLVGTQCYLKCKEGPNQGLLYTVGTEYNGVLVQVTWEENQPTQTPKLYEIKHLQRVHNGTVRPRAYAVHSQGAADEIGIIINPDQIVPVEKDLS